MDSSRTAKKVNMLDGVRTLPDVFLSVGVLFTHNARKIKASLAHFFEHGMPGGALAWQLPVL